MMGHVSELAILGIAFSAIISIGLPVVLLILVKKRLGAKAGAAGIGALTFVLFALVLEQILHVVMLRSAGDILNRNVWIYAVYGGLAAAVFEETGRFVAMKFWMKKTLSKENSLMYGVGHGGIESMLIVGFTCIGNLITAVMINSGQIEAMMATVEDGTGKELALQAYSALWTTPGYQFYLAGVERISAIALQIGLSYLVYRAVRYGEKKFFTAALGIHFLVDAVTILLSNYMNVVVLEIVLLVLVAALLVWVKRLYGEEENGAKEKLFPCKVERM